MTSIRKTFRTENDRRSYELEDENGRKLLVEEVDSLSIVIRREDGEFAEGCGSFGEEISPLLLHFAKYGNLPLPE